MSIETMKQRIVLGLAAALLLTQMSLGAAPLPEQLKPCVSMRRDSERLACYDKAVASIESGLAGVPAPSAENMFGANAEVSGTSNEQADTKREELKQISGQVTSAHRTDDGMMVITLDNGQVWRQQDNDVSLTVGVGDSVNIVRASLGTFRVTDKRGRSARVKRLR
jgi:hypothetical protein